MDKRTFRGMVEVVLAVFGVLLVLCGVVPRAQAAELDSFALMEPRLVVSPSQTQLRLTAFGTLAPANARLQFKWIVQGGTAQPYTGVVSGWAFARVGPQLVLGDGEAFVLRTSLEGGVFLPFPGSAVKPAVDVTVSGSAASGRLTWVSVNALSFDTVGGAPFYYHEGYITGFPLPDPPVRLGWFWERTAGHQTGPRFEARGCFFQVGIVDEPMFYLGYAQTW